MDSGSPSAGHSKLRVATRRTHLFRAACRSRYSITDVLYNCPKCGGLLEVTYDTDKIDPDRLKRLWRERRCDNAAIEQSGVWRYREFIEFLEDIRHVITLREGNTPLLPGPRAAQYGGLDRLVFKHQGFNPTGSFKDNGMTCGASQAIRLGMRRVACVSTGNTSASMAAYASAAGLQPIIFIPHGNISYGKLAQALEYGALTLQVEANFDQILKLVRVLSERLGIYLLNSINPFRIEGQKSIVIEMMDQRDWNPPDWIVLPGGNLGNVSAFGKALRELHSLGFISRMPRLAVIQAEKSAPFFEYMRRGGRVPRHREARDTGHRDPHRRSCLLAQSRARDPHEQWRCREGNRAGDRRREGQSSASAASDASRHRRPRLAGIRKLRQPVLSTEPPTSWRY